MGSTVVSMSNTKARPDGRPDEVEQRPDGRGLAGAIRSEEPEHLARLHLEVELHDPTVGAIALGEALGADDGGHATPFHDAAES